jgi:hypothetical protein
MERGCQFEVGQVAHVGVGRGSERVQVVRGTMVLVLAGLSSEGKSAFL